MFRLILVQFTEARPIGHYDGSVNRLCPELSTASVDERYVPSQVQREHMAVSALDDLPFDNASAGRCSVGSVVIPFHPGVTASQRHISPGFWPNDPGSLLILYPARLQCHHRGDATRSPVLRLNIEAARCEAGEYPDATQQPR